MSILRVAERYAARQVALARETANRVRSYWTSVEPSRVTGSWRSLVPDVLATLGTSQATAAASAGTFVDDILTEYGLNPTSSGRIQPSAFAGIASDGRPLAGLMMQPAVTALDQIGRGARPAQAISSGTFVLDMITRTQVADAGRVAVGVAVVTRPQITGYVRMLVGSSCSRCIILAGRSYGWNSGFERHPRCDCRHIPVIENRPGDLTTDPKAYFNSLSAEEQDRIFTEAGAEAIRKGSDMAKVVNARRGMVTADGRLYTTEAAGRRPRLMPEQIFKDARDREDALRLLRRHGYIT